MKRLFLFVLTTVLALTFTLTAAANPYGGLPRSHTFPPGMNPAETVEYSTIKLPTASRGWPGTY